MKRVTVACLLAVLFCLLSGCLLESPDQLYSLPSPGQDYVNLKSKLDQVSASLGAEYAAPLTGSNTQTVQLVDLDGDGVQEAVAFFRVSSAEKPLKVYILKQDGDGNYEVAYTIEGEGTAINSISYENLGGSDDRELIVSWQLSENVHTLAAYSLKDKEVVELMRSGYTKYEITDLDNDGRKEILLIQVDSSGGNNRVEYYHYADGVMQLSSSAPISLNVTEVSALRSSYLANNVPAVYVTSSFGVNGGVLTDIYAIRDGVLKNITLDEATGMSNDTICYDTKTSPQDINNDTTLEIPIPQQVPVYSEDGLKGAGDYWLLNWYQYNIMGEATLVYTTYHDESEGWYFIIPETWRDEITISQSSALLGVQETIFSRWNGTDQKPEPFLSIYKLTGTNRVTRAQTGERFQLLPEADNTIYAAEFPSGWWKSGLDQEEVISRFNLIKSEWSTEGAIP